MLISGEKFYTLYYNRQLSQVAGVKELAKLYYHFNTIASLQNTD